MSSAKPRGYRFSPMAFADLEEVWRYTAETWSIERADTYIDDLSQVFDTLAMAPGLGREWTEFTPPVRIHPHGQQVLIYTVREGEVIVLRVLGGRQDWLAILRASEL